MAIYYSILAWKIPWTEKPSGLHTVHGVTKSQMWGTYTVIRRQSTLWASLVAQRVKCLPTMWETWVRSLGWEDPLEKKKATHSNTLAWKIPWTEEPGRLQSIGLQRVGHD